MMMTLIRKYLFSTINKKKNAEIDKYKYSGYGFGFDRRGIFQ